MSIRLWLRADGSASTGLGHVMRLLAVVERARDAGLEPQLVVGGEPTALKAVERRGFAPSVVEEDQRMWLNEIGLGDAVIFDGYHFTAELLLEVGRRARRVGAVDDFEGGDFPVDVLVNQNPVVKAGYRLNPGGVALVGPRYALVRREFLRHRRYRGGDAPRTLLVTMGGSDVAGLTRTTIEQARWRDGFDRLLVVVGPAATMDESDLPADVEIVRAPADVAATFARADAAISAAGSTTWELLAMGLPTALVQVADNQRHIGPGVEREGAGIFLGGVGDFRDAFPEAIGRLADPTERRRLSTRALELVDGLGANRFLDTLQLETVRPRRSP